MSHNPWHPDKKKPSGGLPRRSRLPLRPKAYEHFGSPSLAAPLVPASLPT
jgi:hypothetical protein